jgi:hypothetical protein
MLGFIINTPEELRLLFKSVDTRARGVVQWGEIINYLMNQIQTNESIEKIVCFYLFTR